MKLLAYFLKARIRVGALAIIGPDGTRHEFGDGSGPQVAARIKTAAVARRIALRPELAIGEAYMEGTFAIEEGTLGEFFAVVYRNRASLLKSLPVRLRQFVSGLLLPARTFNLPHRARRNVAHHYDLSGELYESFLDDRMQYSCAYFSSEGLSLEEAQRAKMIRLAAKLDLREGMRVLDIGSGWGGLALQLAGMADIEVLGITLSREQHKAACEAAQEAGLSDRVKFELRDWREVQGSFDRIVSVGMFEHVGPPLYVEFFAKVGKLLSQAGTALIHSIGYRSGPISQAPWIAKYIFPGGYAPILSQTVSAVERSGLWMADIEIWRGLHYANTLRAWHERFAAKRERFAELYDERFCRMWEFYLRACEAEFRYGDAHVFQLQVALDRASLPATRDYMHRNEQALLAK